MQPSATFPQLRHSQAPESSSVAADIVQRKGELKWAPWKGADRRLPRDLQHAERAVAASQAKCWQIPQSQTRARLGKPSLMGALTVAVGTGVCVEMKLEEVPAPLLLRWSPARLRNADGTRPAR